MKKRTYLWISIAVCALLALFGLTLYLTFSNLDTLFADGPTAAQSNADAAIAALFETEAPVSARISEPAADSLPFIWVGDSRTIGMQNAMDNEDCYIGAAGEGYHWFKETGLSLLQETMKDYPQSPVIFNFGVNDYDNLALYLSLYKEIVSEYPDTHFYFLSVNPIEPTICKNITNEEICDFNAHLKADYPDTYLDSYTYLMVNEVATIDGIHYSEEGYRQIYEYATEQINKKEL